MAWKRHLWSTDLALVTFLTSSFLIPSHIVPTYSILALYLIPMGQKRPLWSTILALATFDMLADLIIGLFLSTSRIMPNLGSLCHPHGLEEAPVAH